MALIKCPECKKEFSNQAEKCPNCGCPVHQIMEKQKDSNVNDQTVDADSRKYGLPTADDMREFRKAKKKLYYWNDFNNIKLHFIDS